MILPFEKEAVSLVIKIGHVYGFGNLIGHLRREWAVSLMNDGLPKDVAIAATNAAPYPVDRPSPLEA